MSCNIFVISRAVFCSKRTLARLQKRNQRIDFLWFKRTAERGHVHAAVYDTDHYVALGKFVAHIGEIWSSTAADPIDQVAIETTSIMKNFCAFENRAAGCADDFLRQWRRIEIWRPRRSRALNPECSNHDHAEQNHSD